MRVERNADNSGREFWAKFWGAGGAWNPGKRRPKKSQKNFAIKFAEKFSSNFHEIRRTKLKKLTPNLLCRALGSKDWTPYPEIGVTTPNTPVKLCFSGYRKLSLLYPQRSSRGALQERGYSGFFGVLRFCWEKVSQGVPKPGGSPLWDRSGLCRGPFLDCSL